MWSIETLAHVDTLCLDKTGTITEGKIGIQRVEANFILSIEKMPFLEIAIGRLFS